MSKIEALTKKVEMIVGVLCVLCCVSLPGIVCPPVEIPEALQEEQPSNDTDGLTMLAYNKYLQEVVTVLEQDEEFRRKLSNTNASHVKSHDFAKELNFVGHQVREKLDEIKRREVKRLRDLRHKIDNIQNGKDHLGHLDVGNIETFEVEDLKKLIRKTTSDLENLDAQRRKQFKTYEMQKEHERQERMKLLEEEQRLAAEKQYQELLQRNKEHPKIHHPGSKAQFEDVWENVDKLDREDFDPKTFFKKHDVDGDGYLNQEELEALFQLELDKLYEVNSTDLNERFEEMYRMREHLMKEVDKDGDKMISKAEFDQYVASQDFGRDEGWKGLDEEQQYSPEEYAEYERMMNLEQAKMVEAGYGAHAQAGEINIPPQQEHVQEMDKQKLTQQPI